MKFVVNILAFIALSFCFVADSSAAQISVTDLPVAAHLDTEVSTNLNLSAWTQYSRTFNLSISLSTTPSNNLEVALGTNIDLSGALALDETNLVIGWDCSSWFISSPAEQLYLSTPTQTINEIKTLSLRLRSSSGEVPDKIMFYENDLPIFIELPPVLTKAFAPSGLSAARITARGAGLHNELIKVGSSNDGLRLLLR